MTTSGTSTDEKPAKAKAPKKRPTRKASKKATKKKDDRPSVLEGLKKAKAVVPGVFASGSDDPFLTTGFYTLAAAMGGGPRQGRVVEIFGAEGCGKTTLAVQLAGFNLGRGEVALFQDHEHSFDANWARIYTGHEVVHLEDAVKWFKKHGEKDFPPVFLWTQPDCLEEGTRLADDLVEAWGSRLRHIIMDSVAAMTPSAQIERIGEMDKKTGKWKEEMPAIRARKLGAWLEPAVKAYNKAGTNLWLVNQTRDTMDTMAFSELAKITTPGGRSVKFYSSHRLFLKAGNSKRWNDILGQNCSALQVLCVKNKVDQTRRGRTQLVLAPGIGFSTDIELLDLCQEQKVLIGAGPGLFRLRTQAADAKGFTRRALLQALWDPTRGSIFKDMLTQELRKVVLGPKVEVDELTAEEVPVAPLALFFDEYRPKTGTLATASDPESVRACLLASIPSEPLAEAPAISSTPSFLDDDFPDLT